jgi:predicted nucleotide-binding protein
MPARKPAAPQPPEPPLALSVSREEARERIARQIDKGRILADSSVRSESELERARADVSTWESYTEELLRRLFTNGSLAEEFTRFWGSVSYVGQPIEETIEQFREDVRNHVHRLESIVERLELLPEPSDSIAPSSVLQPEFKAPSRRIFVVHGHNDAIREKVSRFLERLKLAPIVLHEQATRGKTIIEKIEANADVQFAVVILTGDDVGAKATENDKLLPRARQNVILELGYFVGRIGRGNVCALYEDGVEIPSDYHGVGYVPLAGAWRFELAKELRAAGIEIDLNLL